MRWGTAAFMLAALAIVAPHAAVGTSSSAVVSATVPSATQLDTSSCASGQTGRTSLGTVLPGTNAIGTTGCSVTFGSSNDSAKLRMYQQDGVGSAMYLPPRGPLDAAFGTSGTWTTNLAAAQDDYYVDGERLADGSYLLLGRTVNANGDAFVEKRDANWTLDGTWGASGRRIIDVYNPDIVEDLELDSAGRALVLVREEWNAAVVRLTTGGSLDLTYGGGDGVASIASWSSYGFDVLPDGRAVIAARVVMTDHDVRMTMLDSLGAIDTTWASTGLFTWDSGTGHDGAYDVVARSDGSVVAALQTPASGGDITLLRLNPAGVLDPTFGSGGAALNLSGSCCAFVPDELEIDDVGRLLVSGHTNSAGDDQAWIIRTSASGVRDPTFGNNGMVSTGDTGSDDNGDAMLLQVPDGAYLLTATPVVAGTRTMKVWRVRDNGAIDLRFGDTGRVRHQVGGAEALVGNLLLDADGRVILVGRALSGTEWNVAAARLDSTRITQFDNAAGNNFLTAGESVFGACLVSVTSATPSAPWSAAGDSGCTTSSPANWQPVATKAIAATAQVASTASGTAGAQVLLRFGLHAHGGLPPGAYVAPLVIETIAP